jgi:hypothetical protein
MFGDGPLNFWEFATREPLPLARIHDAVLEFLRGRNDAVLVGAHAVNAYVDQARMSEDVDLLSQHPLALAKDVRQFLHQRFGRVFRVRMAKDGTGYCVFQPRRQKERRLVEIFAVEKLPPAKRVKRILVATPPVLIASKTISFARRRRAPEGGIDCRDAAVLLLAFPELKKKEGPVAECLRAARAGAVEMAAWVELVNMRIEPEVEDAKFLDWNNAKCRSL